MAMSGQYSKNDKNKSNGASHVTVFSPYTFANPESTVDQTKLASSFEMGMLKLKILPRVQDNSVSYVKYSKDEKEAGVAIYLTHTKALLLLKDAKAFFDDPTIATSVGVDSGLADNQGLIQFSNGAEFGTTNTCLVIRRLSVDENGQGTITASYVYEFKTQSHYTIRNFDANTMEFDRIYHDDLEIEQFFILLDQYIKAQTNAVAFTVREQLNYQDYRINNKLDAVGEKLGIEYKGGSNKGGNKPSVSIFGDKNSGRTFNTSTISDIDNM